MNKSFINSIEELKKSDKIDKPYRLKQIVESIFVKNIFDFNLMTNIPQHLRSYLSENFYILEVNPVEIFRSKDGTIKFLFGLKNDDYVESVYLKDKNNRVTFCISSQVGCRMGCKFCKTGQMGLIRDLTYSEIISQILYLSSVMRDDKNVVDTSFNIVFMGMGEPLDNFGEVVRSLEILTDGDYFNLSQGRITLSTSGINDKIEPLLERFNNIKIALSLISANNAKRASVMPVTNKFPVEILYKTLSECYKKYKNRFTLEYVLIKNFNMSNEDIDDLELFNKEPFHINLIPLNHSDDDMKRPAENEIKAFQTKLEKKGFCVTRRYRRGDDINADCGQLFRETLRNGSKSVPPVAPK